MAADYPVVRGLSWTITRSPKYETLVQRASSGKEFRMAYWNYPLFTWELQYNYLKDNPADPLVAYGDTDLRVLQSFFMGQNGQFSNFTFDDSAGYPPGTGPYDSVNNYQIGSGDGTTTIFQFFAIYGPFRSILIQAPDLSTIQIFVNGILQVYGTDYSVDAIGNLIFASAPGSGLPITWTGGYFFPVRFGSDDLDVDTMMFQLWELKKVTLQQVRL